MTLSSCLRFPVNPLGGKSPRPASPFIAVEDAGADGTGTTLIASRGGASVAWAADGVYEFTMGSSDPYPIDADDWVALKWDETGTVAATGTLSVVLAPGQRGTT